MKAGKWNGRKGFDNISPTYTRVGGPKHQINHLINFAEVMVNAKRPVVIDHTLFFQKLKLNTVFLFVYKTVFCVRFFLAKNSYIRIHGANIISAAEANLVLHTNDIDTKFAKAKQDSLKKKKQ